MRLKRIIISAIFVALLSTFSVLPMAAGAEQGNFSLQVTPSPLVLSIKPGESTTSDLNIRNNGDKTENLKIELRSFTVGDTTNQVSLNDSAPADVSSWVTFAQPTFTIAPGQWFTEKITVNLPSDAGFSYAFALVISRANDATSVKPGESALKGSVAVFTLISVDRPDAKKQLEVTAFQASQKVYEYLPATFKVTFKNTGNTIVQPYGNIFVQRTASSNTPLSTLPVNEAHSYILPGTSRTVSIDWGEGFPAYVQTQTNANTGSKKQLIWDWSKLSNIRFGRYSAKLVAVYNDGTRDVPLEADTSFWIIPWKIIGGLLVVTLLLVVGVITIIKKGFIIVKRSKSHAKDEPTN